MGIGGFTDYCKSVACCYRYHVCIRPIVLYPGALGHIGVN